MLDQVFLAALNHLLQDAAWARGRLMPFAGRAARLSLPPFRLDFAVTTEGMMSVAEHASPDVEIALPAETPLLAFQGRAALADSARISGSAEFADALGFVLRNLRWDFEEDLSKLVGDIAAHRIAGLIAAFGAWQGRATRHLAENVAEYLTEEKRVLLNRREVASFSGEVERLRDDQVRLEQRIAKLGG